MCVNDTNMLDLRSNRSGVIGHQKYSTLFDRYSTLFASRAVYLLQLLTGYGLANSSSGQGSANILCSSC